MLLTPTKIPLCTCQRWGATSEFLSCFWRHTQRTKPVHSWSQTVLDLPSTIWCVIRGFQRKPFLLGCITEQDSWWSQETPDYWFPGFQETFSERRRGFSDDSQGGNGTSIESPMLLPVARSQVVLLHSPPPPNSRFVGFLLWRPFCQLESEYSAAWMIDQIQICNITTDVLVYSLTEIGRDSVELCIPCMFVLSQQKSTQIWSTTGHD